MIELAKWEDAVIVGVLISLINIISRNNLLF